MIKKAILFTVLLVMNFSFSQKRNKNKIDKRPNIIVIIADDLGYGDLGYTGSKDIPTPNLDKLARGGVKFNQAYAYNVCSPTRASFLTGCYAERSGINTVLMGENFPDFANATLLPKLLQGNGYITGLVGKWHLGYTDDVIPSHMGFDEVYGFRGGKIDYFKHTDQTQKNGTPEGKHDFWEGEKEIFPKGYSTDLFSNRAQKFIRDHAKQPFYLQLAYNAPHYSTHKGVFQAPADYLKKFRVTGDPNNTRGAYAAMVNCMDDGIGRVLNELKRQKIENNTLVIFISDNGGEVVASNAPFSGGKHTNKEGGIRIPMIANWPGVIPAGLERNDIVHVMDLMPTLLWVTKTVSAKPLYFDGVNIWSAFINKEVISERTICFPKNTIRKGKWKFDNGKLFNIDTDPKEMEDVAAQNPELCTELNRELNRWQVENKISIKK